MHRTTGFLRLSRVFRRLVGWMAPDRREDVASRRPHCTVPAPRPRGHPPQRCVRYDRDGASGHGRLLWTPQCKQNVRGRPKGVTWRSMDQRAEQRRAGCAGA